MHITVPLFFKSKMLILHVKIKIQNCLFISKYINKLHPIFISWFIFSFFSHNYESSFATKSQLKIPAATTTTYGKEAFLVWQQKHEVMFKSVTKDPMINTFSPNKLNIFLLDFHLNLYQIQGLTGSSRI